MTEAIGDTIVHGLAGLLAAILLLEFFVRWKRNREVEPGILFLLTIAAMLGVAAGAAHFAFPGNGGQVAQWPAGCLFGLGISAALAFYFKRRHRDIYLAEHDRPTCFRTTVMKHRLHQVEGNMQMGYTTMLFLATGSLAASAFIGELTDNHSVQEIADSAKEETTAEAPRTMAELVAQADSEVHNEPEPEPEAMPEPASPEPEIATGPEMQMDDAQGSADDDAMAASNAPPTEPMAVKSEKVIPVIQRPKNIPKDVFATHIRPILSKNCFSCHGPEKQKGGLRLDTNEGVRKGGKSGASIVAGDPEKSTLYTSTVLPADDPDIMPAKGDPLSKRDTELLRKWILYGADLGDGKHIADAASGGTGFAVDQRADGVPLPEASLLEQLKTEGVIIRAVSANQALLDVDFTHIEDKKKLDLKRLSPIAENIHALDLTRSRVSNDDLAAVASMKNLVRLQLNRTSISDQGLEHLKGLSNLETLNLYSTEVTDAGLAQLTSLQKLQKLYLWESKATPEGGEKLKSKLPKLKVIF
ncbi:MAG: c-type cytochrome domain-containing protein [Verrucomicrobiales bacterium]